VQVVEERQGLMVACVEEIAYRMGHIGIEQLVALARAMGSSSYGEYLLHVAEQEAGHAVQ
jgi:glucose-1-phosphate thymidylyltransferase